MKYFSPSYWFKLWVLTAPLFNDKIQGINVMSIDNKKIKDWASKNTTDIRSLENQELTLANNQTNQNIDLIYQIELETSTHKHRYEKSRNKRDKNPNLENKENLKEIKDEKNTKTQTISLNNYLKFINKNFKEINEFDKLIQNIVIDSQNNIYFNNKNSLYVFKYNEKKIMPINLINQNNEKEIISINLNEKNDNVYITIATSEEDTLYNWKENNNELFLLKNNETTATKIKGIPNDIILHYIDSKNNDIYCQTKSEFYILKNNETTATKIKGIPNDTIVWTIDIKDKIIYFGGSTGAFILKNNETTATKIKGIQKNILAIASDSNDNIYFSTYSEGLYFLKNGEKTPIKIIEEEERHIFNSIIIDKNDNVFLGEGAISFLKNKKDQLRLFTKKINEYLDFVVDKDNNIYIGTKNHDIFTIKNSNLVLQKIKNYLIYDQANTISSAAAFHPNYGYKELFPERQNTGVYFLKSNETVVTKDEILSNKVNSINIDKNNNIFFATEKGIYFKSSLFNTNINIYNLENIYNINDETILNNLKYSNTCFLKKCLFNSYQQMEIINKNSKSAKIMLITNGYTWTIFDINYYFNNNLVNINLFNLLDLFKRVITIDKSYFYNLNRLTNLSVYNIKNINIFDINNLNFWNVEVTRDSKLLHSVDFKNACFNKKEKINRSSIIKTLRIPKCQYNSTSKLSFQITKGLSKKEQENKPIGWNIYIEDEIKLNDFINLNNKDSEIINTLSENFDISNINKQEQEMILVSFNEDEEELQVAPKERVEFKYSVREINLETSLNLKQKITGTFSTKIINDENQEEIIILSAKEAMQTLQKYSLLPNEFNINEDNSITFNGKAKISLTQEADPKKIENYFSI